KRGKGKPPGDADRQSPTEEELATLPRWARVAFAARCARRVQPLFKHFWPAAPEEQVRGIDTAITLSERSAAHAHADANADAAANAADFAAGAANAANAANAAASAYAAAASAYAAAASAADAANAINAANAAYAAANAAKCAFVDATDLEAVATTSDADDNTAAARAAMRRDFELLKAAAKAERWTDDTPVPPEFFGPLWPDGEPEGWPESAREERAGGTLLEITIEVPDDADDDAIEAAVKELAARVDDMHRAEGGRGIVIDAVELPLRTPVGQGVL
ncbi:MAG: hypothetical protein KIS87_15240, partial [Phycisphaeraceae bacterium]|nr:hypothetical protein [Phycisphaeraceae bacterium]